MLFLFTGPEWIIPLTAPLNEASKKSNVFCAIKEQSFSYKMFLWAGSDHQTGD